MTKSLVGLSGALAIGTGIGLLFATPDVLAGWLVILAGCLTICRVRVTWPGRERRASYANRDCCGRRPSHD